MVSIFFSEVLFLLVGDLVPFGFFTFVIVMYVVFRRKLNLFNSPISEYKINKILGTYFTYYQLLNEKAKKDFILSTAYFITRKEIIPKGMKLNDFTKVIISALFAQITFGRRFRIDNFEKVLIYEDAYQSPITKKMHKGEVNVRMKTIVLSLKSVLEGIADPKDGINLALHELAHAFKWDNIMDKNNIDKINAWAKVAKNEMERMQENPNHFLRQYGASNIHEMFAVCTDNFFERPNEFEKILPSLYNKMVLIYMQDPRKVKDPRLPCLSFN